MELTGFQHGKVIADLRSREEVADCDLVWLDFFPGETNWPERVGQLTGLHIHEEHLWDSTNRQHPPIYDYTAEYELLVLRSLIPGAKESLTATRSISIYLSEKVLITIRTGPEPVLDRLKKRLTAGLMRAPDGPVNLLSLILTFLADEFLALREPLSLQLENWQSRLLDERNDFTEWRRLMDMRGQLRRFELQMEGQLNVLSSWRLDTDFLISDHLAVRFSNVEEHLQRVLGHVRSLEQDIESLVQIYFSVSSQRTNETMQVLTVISAIFLPLNLIAGIFGMNFEDQPLLHSSHGFWFILGLMIVIMFVMLWLFRSRKWY
ncbi:MAG: magnesium transporter CorA family protein [Gammaproteobacteria bacterium]|jgi:magnesium transporter